MPQLDGLRALAVLGVLYFHFYQKSVTSGLPWGALGVRLFFVLSGFLITGILLRLRDDRPGSPARMHRVRQFYVRRSLRILPLAYLVIIGMAAAGVPSMRETLPWNLTYTSNIYMSLRGAWPGSASHFWSLAVEEQFYLLWPWLIVFLPARFLRFTIVVAILIAPVYVAAGAHAGLNAVALDALTPACLDELGAGSLLALLWYERPDVFRGLGQRPLYRWMGLAAIPAVIALLLSNPDPRTSTPLGSLAVSFFFAWVVHRAALGFGGVWGRLLESRPLVYAGRVSYGVYVLHNFVPPMFERFHLHRPAQPFAEFLTYTGVTLLLASCSWFFFERPINGFRRRFAYREPAAAPAPSAGDAGNQVWAGPVGGTVE